MRSRRHAAPWARLWGRLTDPRDTTAGLATATVLLALEAVLCGLIIWRVPYTEIDWVAYMQEVAGYRQGELDYVKLKGDTGPLVYPAGFVYLFSWLQSITGGEVLPAQVVFAALYLATQALVMLLYIKSRSMPPWTLVLLCLSRRLHSIYVLRLFNDCWAMFIAYAATLALQWEKWTLAVLLYSAAVSVKMNVLLMAPGVLAVVLKGATVRDLTKGVVAGLVLQLALGAPFLLAYPSSYVSRAFEFSRVFAYKWTVNWRVLPEAWFTSQRFAFVLLALQLRLLWSFAQRKWFSPEGGLAQACVAFWHRASADSGRKRRVATTGDNILYIVFTANFIGILCSRTLHYQFYCWYFHSLPFLFFKTKLPTIASLFALICIEGIWNIFPATPASSAVLLVLHVILAVGTFSFPQTRAGS